jgi:TPP-dependent pyruvate/acetoin dehydrogenase alpha subunit
MTSLTTVEAANLGQVPRDTDFERLYEIAKTIQLCDRRVQADVKSATLKAATYPVTGLEGVCASLGMALRPEDYLVSTYRNLGDVIAKDLSLRSVIAEVAGRSTGVAKGKGGAMHIADASKGLMTTTGIVGSGLPIATGLGLSSLLAGDGRVTAVTFGDGATSIGAFHEAMNLAAVWKLPVLFVCQNNGWAEHTPIEEHTLVTDMAAKASAYGMASATVDGFDVFATLATFADAVGHIRAGKGPFFVEAKTYRMSGHTSTADYSYMPAEALAKAREGEAVGRLRRELSEGGLVESSQLDAIDQKAAAIVADAFEFAYASPYPEASEAFTDVFGDYSNKKG